MKKKKNKNKKKGNEKNKAQAQAIVAKKMEEIQGAWDRFDLSVTDPTTKIKGNLKTNDISKTIYLGDFCTGIARVGFGDLLERFKNSADFGGGLGGSQKEIISEIKKINFKNCNSVLFTNGADGSYPFFVGVDKNNNIKKIIMEVNVSNYDESNYSASKDEIHDQFFNKSIKFEDTSNVQRIKLFNFNLKSGLIAIADSDLFEGYHSTTISKWKDEKLFIKEENYQTNYPTGVLNFIYSDDARYEHTKIINFIEPLSILLDESCYPTKYIFKDYLEDDYYWKSLKTWKQEFPILNIKKNIKLNEEILNHKLQNALKILEKQTKILFKDNFKKIFEVRKKELENFIIGIIQDTEPQKLNLPTFDKQKVVINKERKILIIERTEYPEIDTPVQNVLHTNYKLNKNFKLNKDQHSFDQLILPFNKGSYPVFLHCYSLTGDKKFTSQSLGRHDDCTDYVKIVIEDLEGCKLTKNKDGYTFKKIEL